MTDDTPTTVDRLARAVAYLRERRLYSIDPNNRFKYVPHDQTNVRRTFEDAYVEHLAQRYDEL
jgi:hypothetical protein